MKKVPMVMQMEAVECGAASLSMILAYYGKWLPLEQVREACNVSRDGCSMKNILLAAKMYGLEPSAYKVSAEDLSGMEPAIIHWNFEHFVVFKGMRKGKAYLNDPGIGPVEIPMDEFRRSFTGVAMTFELTGRFQPSGRPTSIFSYIKHNLSGANEAFWLTFIFTLLLAVVTLTLPLLTRVFFDEILSGRNAQWATIFFCLMAVLALFNFIVTLWQQRYSKRIAGQLALRGNINYLRHLLRLPMNFFAMRYVGDLQQRQRLNESITHSLVEVLAPQAINVMLLVLYFILMLSYNYMLAMIGVAAALVNLAVVHHYAGQRLNMVRSTQQSMGKYYSATVSCLENIESIKAAGAEGGFFQYWSGLWSRMFNKQREMRIQQSEMSLLPTLTSNLLTMAVLLVGAWYILQGDLSVGMLMGSRGENCECRTAVAGDALPDRACGRRDEVSRRPACRRRTFGGGQAAGRAGTARRHLRLQPDAAAPDRPFQPAPPGWRVGSLRGQQWLWQIHPRQTDIRTLQALERRDTLRRASHREHLKRRADQLHRRR